MKHCFAFLAAFLFLTTTSFAQDDFWGEVPADQASAEQSANGISDGWGDETAQNADNAVENPEAQPEVEAAPVEEAKPETEVAKPEVKPEEVKPTPEETAAASAGESASSGFNFDTKSIPFYTLCGSAAVAVVGGIMTAVYDNKVHTVSAQGVSNAPHYKNMRTLSVGILAAGIIGAGVSVGFMF